MFSQVPDEVNSFKNLNHNRRRRRKKKNINKNHSSKNFKRPQARFALTMSSWAENFTVAATWQLKHQIAYWKSKAMALEYENQILHKIIKKNCLKDRTMPLVNNYEEMSLKSDTDSDEVEEFVVDDDGDEENFEVSEEYMQFLMDNAKYKEDARIEREKLKAKKKLEEDEVALLEAGPSNAVENTEEIYKQLYGKKWQRISALETSLQSNFISNCDLLKPMYWPNIPFNFNFS